MISDFLCEPILGKDIKVKFKRYFTRLDFEVLKVLKQLIVRKLFVLRIKSSLQES